MVKSNGAIWNRFKKDASKPNNVKAQCNYCKQWMQGIKKRLESHARICPATSEEQSSDVEVIGKI